MLGRQCVGFIDVNVSLSPLIVASLFSPALLSLIQPRVSGSTFHVLVVARVCRQVARLLEYQFQTMGHVYIMILWKPKGGSSEPPQTPLPPPPPLPHPPSKLYYFSLGNVNIFYYFACVYLNFLLLSMCAWPLVQYKVTILSITVETACH